MPGDFSSIQTNIYKSLIYASFCAFIIGIVTTGVVSFHCYQTGYAVLGIGIMMIVVQILNQLASAKDESSSIGTYALNLTPFVVTLSVLASLLYFSIMYKEIIVEERVSQGFFVFSNIVIILILIQTYIIFSGVSSETFKEKGIPHKTLGLILLFAVLSGIATNIIRTILKYFTTDGFKIMKVFKI